MKKLFLILILLFSVMFSSLSYAEWTKVGVGGDGNTYYIDFERIKKHGGYVYWWDLNDLLKPDKDGYVTVSEKPGLGYDLNMNLLKKHQVL